MAIQPLAPLQDLLPKATLGTSGQDVIKEVQEQQVLQAQTQNQAQAALNAQAQAAQAAAEAAQKRLEQERKLAFQTALADAGRSPTSEQYAAIAGQFPEFSEGMKVRLSQLTAKEADALVGNASPAFAALAKGRVEVALPYLERLVRVNRAKGNVEKAEEFQGIIDMAKQDPYMANGALGGLLVGIMGKEKFDGMVTSIGLEDATKKAAASRKREELAAEAEGDVRGGLLAQGRQTVATGAAQAVQALAGAGASRATAAKAAEETAQLKAAGPSNLIKAEQEALSARAKAIEDTNRAINSPVMQMALAQKALSDAKIAASQAQSAPEKQALEVQALRAKVALDELTVKNAPIDMGLKTEALRLGNAQVNAQIADLANKHALAEKEFKLKETEAANKFRMEMTRLQAENMKLEGTDKTRISGFITEANKARQTIALGENLLLRVERDSSMARVLGRPWNAIRDLASIQEADAALRKDLSRFINKDMLTQIPPGALSNEEQRIIRQGLPDVFDNDVVLKLYLSAAVKVARGEAEVAQGRAYWESQNGGSAGPARQPIKVMGIAVKKGEDFETWKKNYGEAQQLERELKGQ
jgi:hypothetical protein